MMCEGFGRYYHHFRKEEFAGNNSSSWGRKKESDEKNFSDVSLISENKTYPFLYLSLIHI